MRSRRKWLWWLAAAVSLVVVAPAVLVELRPPDRPAVRAELPATELSQYSVYVVDWGYHTAIILEQPRAWRLGPEGDENAAFVEYAWGDRRFYMESNYWPHAVFTTLFLPTESVTYVDGWQRLPVRGYRSMHVRNVSVTELRALASELEASIVPADGGARSDAFPSVRGYSGRFYPGIGSYLWWTNCNRWTADRLATVGLASGGRGVLFSRQVASRLHGFSEVRGSR